MTITNTKDSNEFNPDSSTTAVDCEKKGHCFHPGTAVGSLVCCKCGKYLPISIGVFSGSAGDWKPYYETSKI